MDPFSAASPDVSDQPRPDFPEAKQRRTDTDRWWESFPWWMFLVGSLVVVLLALVVFNEDYRAAWSAIFPGIYFTISATFSAFAIATVLGLLAGMGQLSQNVVFKNLARAYIEIIRGIPMIVLIFVVALVVVPDISKALGVPNSVPTFWRAVIALALIYGAYIAEIFRGGIQSVPIGQVEAGRSLGLSKRSTTWSIVLPQAMRSILPPLGNDFIAILKDTSLLSVLGVLELTRNARQFNASTFKIKAGFYTMCFVYLVLVLALSAFMRWFEAKMSPEREGER